ncbi:MAG: hypothetical protein M4579_000704 [Chaenotheca gracillima]|nr:MAG: hypothetical protein M4579_000704 [Chaenotheca gracillima]
MQQRKDEILAKKAKLAEIKRQRELRQSQLSHSRQGDGVEIESPSPRRGDSREKVDELVQRVLGESRPSSTGLRDAGSGAASASRGSRPNSVLSAGDLSVDNLEIGSPSNAASTGPSAAAMPAQTSQPPFSTAPLSTIYSFTPDPVKEVLTYSKAVQTSEAYTSPRQYRQSDGFSDSERDESPSNVRTPKNSKRMSRRERERDEELRQNIRKEIEEELRTLKDPAVERAQNGAAEEDAATSNFPARTLTNEELNAVTSSGDFLDFVERSSKVIERALDEEYDVLADYALRGPSGLEDEDDEQGGVRGRGRRRVREVAQFWDERWSKKRMISNIAFSPKFPELVLASYTKNPTAPHDPDGLVQVWNLHLHDRAEYVFHAQSDVLVAKFSPFHPNLVIGGAYSGQVLLWDTRAKSAPVQKTPLTGSGHTHPVYAIDIVGTQNANNIISCSTDGVVCGWSVDMLAQPQELLELTTPPPGKADELAPTCMAFPQADPTFFLAGTEDGTIYPCHRYDRAGARAGVDQRISYRGHAGPIMSLDFHPPKGPIDLSDLVLSSSLDWSAKLWKVRAPASSSTTSTTGAPQVATPLIDFTREDVVYDASWSPVKPGVFALVDGAGNLEIWDITIDTEVPVARTQPSGGRGTGGAHLRQSLNKVAWEEHEGKKVAVGGLDGVVTVFEVGSDLGGADNARLEEWASVKKLVARIEAGNMLNDGPS